MQKIHKKRVKKLQSYKKNVLILNSGQKDPNFFYYTGMEVDYGALFIPSKGLPKIMISEMDAQKYSIPAVYNIGAKLKRIMKGKTVYTNYNNISMRQAVNLGKLKDASHILSEIRAIKSREEVETIRKNALISEKIIKTTKTFGRSETDVAAEINNRFFKEGGQPAYDTIVAGGSRTKNPHHIPTKRKISKIAYIDAGIKKDGYISDITRAWCPNHKKQLQLILDAIQASEDLIKDGVAVSEIDKAARKALGDYSKYFIHALGHGIGLDVHEAPNISSGSKEALKEGMVITIEPGIYTKSYGIRVENDYLLTKKGFKRLTNNVN